jgi:hypothetical protein
MLKDEKEVLGLMLQKLQGSYVRVTYPAVFVHGAWLPGGYQELQKLHDNGGLHEILCDKQEFKAAVQPLAEEDIPKMPTKPQLCHQAGGGPWLTFQTRMYGNVLRGIAFLQLCVLVPAHLMNTDSMRNYSIPLLLVLFVDSFIFVVMGPTPIAPLGMLSTSIVWRRRGAIVPALPYKVTFLFYVIASMACIVCPHSGEDGSVCKLLNSFSSDNLVYTLMVNSIYLTIFRF